MPNLSFLRANTTAFIRSQPTDSFEPITLNKHSMSYIYSGMTIKTGTVEDFNLGDPSTPQILETAR